MYGIPIKKVAFHSTLDQVTFLCSKSSKYEDAKESRLIWPHDPYDDNNKLFF